MNKKNRVFWMILSILFAAGAIITGSIYEKNEIKQLNAMTNKSTGPAKNSQTSTSQETTETKQENNTADTGEKAVAPQEETTAEGQAAQQLIDKIIVNGEVSGDFTLEEYQTAKAAVDSLPEGAEKEKLQKQITVIETALTNMGVSY